MSANTSCPQESWGQNADRGTGQYKLAPELDYIDGIFVPDGENGPVQISSAGHQFANCPDTDNHFWGGIVNSGNIIDPSRAMAYHPMVLGEQRYGSLMQPGIFVHANIGITFDLDNIRNSMPGVKINRFTARLGIEDSESNISKSKFWVLVDGKIRFQMLSEDLLRDFKDISVQLAPNDHFLTLVTTDGADGNGHDWCIFAMPALELEQYCQPE